MALRREGRVSLAVLAERLGMASGTLQSWVSASERGHLTARPRGRPPCRLDRDERQMVIHRADAQPGLGLPRLRQECPELGRNAAAELLRRHHVVRARRRRRGLQRLSWLVPGTVWAMDGTWMPWRLLGHRRLCLVTCDLAGAGVIDCAAGAESGNEVLARLEPLFASHGAPLVLKVDNGSGFLSEQVRRLCTAWGVTLLHSPPRCPRYNGACEVSNRWSKVRILRAARAAGREGFLEPEDLAAACSGRPAQPVPEALRAAFLASLAGHRVAVQHSWGLAAGDLARHPVRTALDRVAVQRALIECHILKIGGRAFDGGCSPGTTRD